MVLRQHLIQKLIIEQQICIRAAKEGYKVFEINGHEPDRIGDQRKMKALPTGAILSLQSIKEFIFYKIQQHFLIYFCFH